MSSQACVTANLSLTADSLLCPRETIWALTIVFTHQSSLEVFPLMVEVPHWHLQLVPDDDHKEEEGLQCDGEKGEPESDGIRTVRIVLSSQTLLTSKHKFPLQLSSVFTW